MFGNDDADPPSVVRLRKQKDQRVRLPPRTTLRMLLAAWDGDGGGQRTLSLVPSARAVGTRPDHILPGQSRDDLSRPDGFKEARSEPPALVAVHYLDAIAHRFDQTHLR